MTAPLDEARLRELADWFLDGDPGGEGSVLLSRSVAIEAGNDIALVLNALSAERERGDRAVGLADYAAHDDECTVNRYPGHDACSCGLSLILQAIRHDLATQKAEGGPNE